MGNFRLLDLENRQIANPFLQSSRVGRFQKRSMKQAKDLDSGLHTRKQGRQTRKDEAALDSTNYVRCNNLDFREGTSLPGYTPGFFLQIP